MLLSFSIENFLSFRDSVEYSAVASREVQHGDRLIRVRDQRVLPATAIFGGNGSGKSNFMQAFKFARHLITVGTEPDEGTGRRAFKLDRKCRKAPSHFRFEIVTADDKCYRYEFSVTNDLVTEEVLWELRAASEKLIFSRQRGSNGHGWNLEFFETRSRFKDEDPQFIRFVARGTRQNQLFLREAVDRNVDFVRPIYDWFASQLVILDPNAAVESLETILNERADLRVFASTALKNADTGIMDLRGEEIPLDAATEIPPEIRESARKELKKEGMGLLFRSSTGHRLSIYLHKGEYLVSKLYTRHMGPDGEPVRFEMEEESEGTRRLIDLLPVFFDLKNPNTRRVFIIDELDRSMHSGLTWNLLESYLSSCAETCRGQLIFTTHEEQLMDQTLLRRDEIWFLNKAGDGASYLECLADYEGVRNDTDIRKAYLLGRYSGIPEMVSLPDPVRQRAVVNS